MCQCVMCECWWHNCYGVNAGCYEAGCCWSCWTCMPIQMRQIDPQECKIGCCLGWGYNHWWHGNVCCISQSLRTYSGIVAGKQLITVNTSRPMQPLNTPGYY